MEKYFTPDIEDIRVGYEYEYKTHDGIYYPKETYNLFPWHKSVVKIGDLPYIERSLKGRMASEGRQGIRVPYLTKEQIEAEEWKFKGGAIDSWFEKKDIFLRDDGHHFTKITLQYGFHDYRLVIKVKFVSGDEEKFFEGECKDINTFRYICKLLKI